MLINLINVKPKFGLDMRLGIVGVSYFIAVPGAKLGKNDGDSAVHGGVSADIGRVVRQRTQSKRQLIHVARLADKLHHKIAAADIVDQIAEEFIARRIIAHVLDQTSAIRKRVCTLQFVGSGGGITLQQQFFDVSIPEKVDDLFVGEYRIRLRTRRRDQETEQK